MVTEAQKQEMLQGDDKLIYENIQEKWSDKCGGCKHSRSEHRRSEYATNHQDVGRCTSAENQPGKRHDASDNEKVKCGCDLFTEAE